MPIMEISLGGLCVVLQKVTSELPPEEADKLIVAIVDKMMAEGRIRAVESGGPLASVSNN